MRLAARSFLIVLTAATAAYRAPAAFGCGPFMPSAVFTPWAHPELPLAPFAAGRLGVLQKRLARSYLVVAYRHLAGVPLTPEEQKSALALWDKRLGVEWDHGEESWLAAWAEARKLAPAAGEPPAIRVSRNVSGDTYYFDFLNCPEDAFRTAAATLAARAKELGATSEELAQWVAAQDQVFASCGEPQAPPADLPAGAGALQKADRAYQIAAARMYAGDYEAAAKDFAAIAKDEASPWKRLAPYLRARALIRRASVGAEVLSEDGVAKAAPLLQDAEEQLGAVLADPGSSELHLAARRMLGLVRLRARGPERQTELGKALIEPDADGSFFQDLWDYTTLLDHAVPVDAYAEAAPQYGGLAKVPRADDLSDWVLTFQSTGPGAFEHSLERWRTARSVPWLLAALAEADPKSPELPQLLEVASKLEPASAGFETASYHRLRLLIELGKAEEARSGLDTVLGSAGLAVSSRNLFLGQRLRLARGLEELLRYAQRTPAVVSYDEGPKQEPIEEDNFQYMAEEESNDRSAVQRMREKSATFDADGVGALDSLPLGLLVEASASAALPEHLRRDLMLGAWTRAVLLEQEGPAMALAAALPALWPELKAGLDAYRAAADPAARRFAAVLLMLRFPGLSFDVGGGFGRMTRIDRIDSFRDNWWCAASELPPALPAFLSAAQHEAARAERGQLASLGTGPNWLARQALDRAAAAPADPSVPEALHLAVRTTRYGCTDAGTGKLSKAAHALLHKNYAASEWAKRTKHWFN